MPTTALERRLADLERCRYQFGPDPARRILKLLGLVSAARFPDSRSLIRFHEALLFLRAFPQSAAVLRTIARLLNDFHVKVEALLQAGATPDEFDSFEFSGIAGTTMEDTLSFDVAHWLIRRLPDQVEIA